MARLQWYAWAGLITGVLAILFGIGWAGASYLEGIPQRAAREQIASAINVVVQVSRLSDGRRRLVSLQEVTGMEGSIITLQEIFSFRQTGIDADGSVKGVFKFHGIRPRFSEKFKVIGINMADDIFSAETFVDR